MVAAASNKWIRGLDLNNNPLIYTVGKDPYGGTRNATTIADECVLTGNASRMIGNRKGFDYFTAGTSAPIDWMYEFEGQIIQHQADNTLWHGDNASGTRTQYTGTYVAPAGYRLDGAVSRGSLFFTSTAGPQKLDAYTDTPLRSGICKGLDARVTTSGTGGGVLSGSSKVGYHVTWRRTDANNQTVRGDVSMKVTLTNANRQTLTSLTQTSNTATATTPLAHGFSTGDTILIAGANQASYNGSYPITVTGSTTFTYTITGNPTSPATGTITAEKYLNASLSFTVPADVQPNDYYEVWRTPQVDASFIDPGDTCYLVTAAQNTTAACGTVTFVDTTTDAALQENIALYTNATADGATQGASRPPMASCIEAYKDYLIFGNTAIDHQITIELLSTAGLVAGTSSIKLAPANGAANTYTFNNTENVATRTIQIYNSGLASLQVQQTMQSLCHVINGDTGGSFYAEYTSGPTDNPGIVRVWARSPLSGAFTVTVDSSTTGSLFTPTLPTSGATVASSNDARPNRLFYSKFQQPDAVPILNTIDVGRQDQPILRVVAVRDSCFVIKADGVWYLSGQDAPFSLIELDSTCHCIAPSTVVMVNNQVYCLSNQGVVQISTSGISVVSVDIEPAIMWSALPLSNLSSVAFAVGHESARQYYLWLPSGAGDTVCKQAYVFNSFIQEWTRWTKPAQFGIALSSNYTLYISSGLENALLKQRNTGTVADYCDESIACTIASQSGTSVTLTWSSTLFLPVPGMALVQGGVFAKVLSVSNTGGSTWVVTVDRAVTYAAGSATTLTPINSHIRLSPNACQEVGMTKTFYSVAFIPVANSISQATIELATNESPQFYSFLVTRNLATGWGTMGWGLTAWGDIVSTAQVIPFQIDAPVPDCTGEFVTAGFYHSVAQEQWTMAQVSVLYDQFAELESTPVSG
jgi:hypothetical protein